MSPAIPWHLLATCESLLSTPTLSMSTLDVLVTTGSGLVILGIVKLPPFRQKQKLITALAQQTCHDARGTLRGPIELPLLISVLLIRISVIVASVYGLGPTSWNSDLLFTILNSALGTWFSIMSAWTIIDYQALLSTALKRSAQESRTEASERGSEVSISRSSSSSSLSQSKELTLLDVELIAGHRVSDLLGQLERCTGAILDLIKRGTRITVLGNYAPVMTACVEYMELLGDVPQTALPPEILRYEDAKEGSAELEKPSTSGCLLVVPTPGALHTASLNLRYIASLVGTSRAAETMRKRRIAFDVGLLLEDACDLLAVYASETGGITVHHPFLFAQRMVGDEDCVRMCFLLVLSHIFESMEHGCNAEVVIDMKPSDKSDGETKAKVGGSGSSTDTVRHLGVIEGSSVGKMILTGHIIFFSPGSSNLINSELASFLSSNGWTFSESCLSNGRRFIDIQSIQNIVDAEEQPAHPASNDIFSFPKLHLVIISDPVSQCGQNLYEDALQYAVNVTFLVKNSKDVLNELAEVLAGTLVAKQDTMIIIEEDTNFLTWLINYRLTQNQPRPNVLVCFLADLRNWALVHSFIEAAQRSFPSVDLNTLTVAKPIGPRKLLSYLRLASFQHKAASEAPHVSPAREPVATDDFQLPRQSTEREADFAGAIRDRLLAVQQETLDASAGEAGPHCEAVEASKSTFIPNRRVRVASEESENSREGQWDSAAPESRTPSPPIRCLVVDDNKVNQAVLSRFFQKANIEHEIADDGQQAVDAFAKEQFHLIFMDIRMPVTNGVEATRQIRRLEKELKRPPAVIVALTSSASSKDRQEALDAGCNDMLGKPISFAWLEKKILDWGSMQALIDLGR